MALTIEEKAHLTQSINTLKNKIADLELAMETIYPEVYVAAQAMGVQAVRTVVVAISGAASGESDE